MAQYWTSRQIAGYSAHTNGSWSSFMNAYASHPFDTSTNDPNNLFASGSYSYGAAPYSGTYTLYGSADNFGAMDLGGVNDTVAGFGNANPKSVSKYYAKGDTINLAWNFGNRPNESTSFNSNPCAIALELVGPDGPPNPTSSLSLNPTAIIQGGSTTLTWSSTSGSTYSLTGVANPGASGSATLTNITASTTYTYTVTNESGSSSTSKTLTVYVPPTLNMNISTSSIIEGQSATISWSINGDGNSVAWTKPVGNLPTNTNASSNISVSPATSTTYCAVASGLGGVSPETCVSLTVYAIPIIEKFEAPASILYGSGPFNVVYETKYANTSLKLEFFNAGYNSGPNNGSSFLEETVVLTTAGSAEAGSSAADANGTVVYNPQWDSFGPRSIIIRLSGEGNGGTFVQEKTVAVVIDETPENINVEETDDKLKSQDPVYTRDIAPQDVVQSDLYLIDDIDIPVEIKSDYPILVDVNNTDTWTKVRQI